MNVKDVPYWAPPAITDDVGQSTVLGLRAGLNRDTRDSYLLPTSGSVIDLGVEQVLGDYQFPIGTAEYNGFFTRATSGEDGSGKHVLALRSQVAVDGRQRAGVRAVYAGGFRSLRGFTLPRGGAVREQPERRRHVRVPEHARVPVAAAGQRQAVVRDVRGPRDGGERRVRSATTGCRSGPGLRVVVPALGPLPIALDFAFPITKSPYDQKQVFSFYVGWFGGQ